MRAVDPPHRSKFTSSNPNETRELLDRMYGWRLEVEEMRRGQFRAVVDQVLVGGIALLDVDMPATVRYHLEAHPAQGGDKRAL